MSSNDRTRIFVYGTLKRGHCRHYVLVDEQYLGEARTAPRYRLLHLGDYPGLIDVADGGRSILGEVYAVSPRCLARLDEIEGVDVGLYARRPIELLELLHEPALTEAYFFLLPADDSPDCGERWP